MFNVSKSPWIKIPLKEVLEPKSGKVCYCDSYWIVTEDECILKCGKASYQCNTNKIIMDKHIENFPGCRVEFFKVLYLENEFGE